MRRAGIAFFAIALLTTASHAADLPRAAPAPVMVAVPQWTGFYLGVNAGYGRAEQSSERTGAVLASGTAAVDGVIGGGQVGYNWQTGALVLGVEADFQGSTMEGRINSSVVLLPGLGVGFIPGPGPEIRLPWFGTVRGRAGFAIGNVMPYVTAGWAYGAFETVGGSTNIRTDLWTVGGGIDFKFARSWSARAEYLYVNGSGRTNVSGPVLVTVSDNELHVARGAVNYHF
jgi:outer membrane immunogenic protein